MTVKPRTSRSRRSFGGLRRLPSGRWQAQYTAPDGLPLKAPRTFQAKDDAVGWLASERRRIELGTWTRQVQTDSPRTTLTLSTYADRWWTQTEGRHKPRTRTLNRGYLDRVILPELGTTPLTLLTVGRVREWFAGLDDFPTRNANAYSLLRTVLNQALDDELISANPCRVRGGSVKHRKVEPVVLSPAQMRELMSRLPDQWRALILLAAMSGLRWGEVAALRRSDLELSPKGMSVTVARGLTKDRGIWVVGRPKSRTAIRTVPLPEALRPFLVEQIERWAEPGRSGLLFPAKHGGFLDATAPRRALTRALSTMQYPHMRIHDLRHSAATTFAQAGATLSDHMALMGHSSSAMSARYVGTSAARNRVLIDGIWTD
ncbi:tyrosine recombinase XerC [Antrihabitans sp. NCIMB 15449]|uniref:Tyrosine recombinase XerC n=1 Tax=Antrihabitans spumae TaxID=3373370 RepID=A0ABW7JUD1_9NOCA